MTGSNTGREEDEKAEESDEAVEFGIEWISNGGDTVELNRKERSKRQDP